MKIKLQNIMLPALLLGLAATSNAQDKATLDLLVSKGVITQAEADKISKDSVKVSPKEKTTKSIKIIGFIQAQYENISVEQFDSSQTSHLASKNDFILRHMYLGADADLGAGWSANIVADFSLSTYINSAFLTKKVDLEYLQGKLDFGYKKVNFGYEENTAISKLFTVERSMATGYWSDNNNGRKLGFGARHMGVFWNGTIAQVEGLEYGLALTNSYNNSPTSVPTGSDNTLMYWANVAYSRKISDVALKVGVNFGYTNGTNVSSSSSPVHSSVYGVNPYITAKLYGFDVWSDFIMSGVNNGKNSYSETAYPMGMNVGVEYKFDIGELGQLGPTVRYSWIDSDGRGISMNDGVRNASGSTVYNAGQSVYIGANWYISGNAVKFQLGYEWAQMNGAAEGKVASTISDANAVRAQMQVMF